jgi:hypothetical protein
MSIAFCIFLKNIWLAFRITFWLYATFQPAHKATRRVAAGWNVPE